MPSKKIPSPGRANSAPPIKSLPPANHAEYLGRLGVDHRIALETVRRAIRAAAPEAEECISYGIPGFRLGGKVFIFYGAAAKHCALYAITSSVLEACKEEIQSYDSSGKGTIRFPTDQPMPAALIRKIVTALIAEKQP